ncbi:MAG: phosphodiesterase [Rhodobacteraceae bacterium]|nr:phosphodiesterase [Paracoccaceae bacterium]NNK68801.1 phosphodiesterase [Paracoccaceae bacterium]
MTPPLPPAFLTRPLTHRALHDGTGACPENSLAAIRASVAAGYGIEVDVQPSGDGVAMVFHDAGLERLTARAGRITDLSAAELGDLTLLGGAEPVPTLADCLAEIGGKVPLLIEVKRQPGGPGALERGVAQALEGYEGPVAVMSYDPRSVAVMRDLMPETPRGLTTDAFATEDYPDIPEVLRERLRAITDFDAVGASFISHDRNDLKSPAVAALKARKVPVLCWTVRSAEQERVAREVADNITFEGYTPAA